MLITIRQPSILRKFGWEGKADPEHTKVLNLKYPSYVTASHKLWWFWFSQNWDKRQYNIEVGIALVIVTWFVFIQYF